MFPVSLDIHCWSLCFVYPMFPFVLDYSLLVFVFRVPNVSLVIRLFIVSLGTGNTETNNEYLMTRETLGTGNTDQQ
jgi:hypothetical protein